MRTLEMLSVSSLTNTVPRPWKGEPSRRMTHISRCSALEVAGIVRFQCRLVHREPAQRSVDGDHRAGGVWTDVALGGHAEAVLRQRLDIGDAGDGGKPPRDAGTFGLDFHDKTCAKHLHRKLGHRAHQYDAAGLEQGDAVADALDLVKQ